MAITEDDNQTRKYLMNKIANEVSEEDLARLNPKLKNMGLMKAMLEEENPGYSENLKRQKQQRLKSQATPDEVNMQSFEKKKEAEQ